MHLLDFLFPRRCVSCGKTGKYFCKKCILRIDFIDKPVCPVCGRLAIDGFTHPVCRRKYNLDGMYALAHFRGPVKKAIHLFKYRLVEDLGKELTELLFKSLPGILPKFDLIIPVPLSHERQKNRGFNQSLVLARLLGTKLHVQTSENVLFRTRNTPSQTVFSPKERRTNIIGAFCCSKGTDLEGRTVALIDDVSTTRSTLLECAKILKKRGAKKVWGIVLAHG